MTVRRPYFFSLCICLTALEICSGSILPLLYFFLPRGPCPTLIYDGNVVPFLPLAVPFVLFPSVDPATISNKQFSPLTENVNAGFTEEHRLCQFRGMLGRIFACLG
ncbi:hypothetical protein B0T19DRAFT_163566 [Cercophora scortea]|uniref:Uncharacterized protein n=1 Tax=Cercophora scortea TaxID=314031 RepID=A0AAE0ILZ2_9PEZI|nr:hypothetical protein B0T19DRAFT_163566 [Cercophora scortea]